MASGVLQALITAGKFPINSGEARVSYLQMWDETLAATAQP